MSHHTWALLQYDIVDQVLSHCVPPVCAHEMNPPGLDVQTPVGLVPKESVWLATAALTCKAWYEPALRHLYVTVHVATDGQNGIHGIHGIRVPLGLFRRIGSMVRTLTVTIDPSLRYDRRKPEFLSGSSSALRHSPSSAQRRTHGFTTLFRRLFSPALRSRKSKIYTSGPPIDPFYHPARHLQEPPTAQVQQLGRCPR
jgi:hypothetical protein